MGGGFACFVTRALRKCGAVKPRDASHDAQCPHLFLVPVRRRLVQNCPVGEMHRGQAPIPERATPTMAKYIDVYIYRPGVLRGESEDPHLMRLPPLRELNPLVVRADSGTTGKI